MKEIKLSNTTIRLDIGEEIRVKDLRKIQPFISEQKQWQEIDMIVNIIKALSPDENVEEIIDNLNIEDFTSLSEQVGEIINTQKKMKKS